MRHFAEIIHNSWKVGVVCFEALACLFSSGSALHPRHAVGAAFVRMMAAACVLRTWLVSRAIPVRWITTAQCARCSSCRTMILLRLVFSHVLVPPSGFWNKILCLILFLWRESQISSVVHADIFLSPDHSWQKIDFVFARRIQVFCDSQKTCSGHGTCSSDLPYNHVPWRLDT